MNISTESEFSIPSISCLLSSLGSIGASAIHFKLGILSVSKFFLLEKILPFWEKETSCKKFFYFTLLREKKILSDFD